MTEKKFKAISEMTPTELMDWHEKWDRRNAVSDKLGPLEARKRALEDEQEELGHRLALARREIAHLERREGEIERELNHLEKPIEELTAQYKAMFEEGGV